jgi:hypothetical protein
MKVVLSSRDVSLVESLRLALNAEEIPAVVGNVSMAPLQALTVSVRDEDLRRARTILQSLQVS